MRADRWATFDCYGTLIDWNGGIRRELVRLFGEEAAPRLLARYHELEPEVQAESFRSYRDVLTETVRRLGAPAGEESALADSLPSWEPFPEVRGALAGARRRSFKLAILSNTDRDYVEASIARIGVPFDCAIVAEDVGSYKPAHGHWLRFFEETGAGRSRCVHVAASLFHDVAPAAELGLTSVWINRLDEPHDPRPARELPDLSGLAGALERLAPPP